MRDYDEMRDAWLVLSDWYYLVEKDFIEPLRQDALQFVVLHERASSFLDFIAQIENTVSLPDRIGMDHDINRMLLTQGQKLIEEKISLIGAEQFEACMTDRTYLAAICHEVNERWQKQPADDKGFVFNTYIRCMAEKVKDSSHRDGLRNLLLQGLVMSWIAFEVLIEDVFRIVLNSGAEMAGRFLITETKGDKGGTRATKEHDRKIAWAEVAEFGFDLTHHIGDWLLSKNYKIDTMPDIKAAFGKLFPSNEVLRQALDNDELRKLHQRRNLIVHRNAVIDAKYQREVDQGSQVNTPMNINPQIVKDAIILVAMTGMLLLKSADDELSKVAPSH